MSDVTYRIYMNDGAGGPIDYVTAVAEQSEKSWTTGSLAYPGLYAFGVRAVNVNSGLEEANTTVVVHVVLDSEGHDVSLVPAKPTITQARALADNTLLLCWFYPAAQSIGIPESFRVVLQTSTSDQLPDCIWEGAYIPGQGMYRIKVRLPNVVGYCTLQVDAQNSSGIVHSEVKHINLQYKPLIEIDMTELSILVT